MGYPLQILPPALTDENFITLIFGLKLLAMIMYTYRIWQPLPRWRKFNPPNLMLLQYKDSALSKIFVHLP